MSLLSYLLLFIGFSCGFCIGCLVHTKWIERRAEEKKAEDQKKALDFAKNTQQKIENYQCKHQGETGVFCGYCGKQIPKMVESEFPNEIIDKCDIAGGTCDNVYRFRGSTQYRRCTICGHAEKKTVKGKWTPISPLSFPSENRHY